MTGHPTPYLGNWIHSFPDHYQWSNATLVCKGMAPTGSVALGEIDQVVQRLHARIDEPQAWWEEWGAMGERIQGYADKAAAEKRDATAGNYYLRAGNYYYTGERMIEPGAQKTAMYRKALHCFHEGLKRRYSNIEFVDVAYDSGAPMASIRMTRFTPPCATTRTGAGRPSARFTAMRARTRRATKVSAPSGVNAPATQSENHSVIGWPSCTPKATSRA